MHMSVFPACMHVYHIYAETRRGLGSLGTGIIGSLSCLWALELNRDPLQEL